MLEVLTRRHYRPLTLTDLCCRALDGKRYLSAEYEFEGKRVHLFTTHTEYSALAKMAQELIPLIREVPAEREVALDFYVWQPSALSDPETAQRAGQEVLNQMGLPPSVQRIVLAMGSAVRARGVSGIQHFTYVLKDGKYEEDKFYRGIHPMMANRLHLWRLQNFNIERLPSAEDVYLLHGVARENPKDERLFACAEVRDLTPVRDPAGRVVKLPHLERMFAETLTAIRQFQMKRPPHQRLYWNRILLNVWPALTIDADQLHAISCRLAPETDGLGLEQVVMRARIPHPKTGQLRDMLVRVSNPGSTGLLMTVRPATQQQPLKPLAEYDQKVVKMRQHGLIYPYEIVKMLTPSLENTRAEFPHGDFVEYDLDAENHLVPVVRPYGKNRANIIVGVIRNFTAKHPAGMTRVLVLGDPSKGMGALAEAECRLINAAIDLAEEKRVPGSGSRFQREQKSRWTVASRTWTGSRGCCAA